MTAGQCDECGTPLDKHAKKKNATDAVIQQFVQDHDAKELYMVVTASTCGPCISMKQALGWSNDVGTAIYTTTDAVALCFTVTFATGFLSDDVVKIESYPTILKYIRAEKKWKVIDDRLVLRKWEHRAENGLGGTLGGTPEGVHDGTPASS